MHMEHFHTWLAKL